MNENSVVMYLVVNKSLNLTAGKIAAQIGHLVEYLIEDLLTYRREGIIWTNDEELSYVEYRNTGTTKIILKADEDQWSELKVLAEVIIVDEGRTECPPNSETVLGFFPMRKSEAPDVIKKLSLL